MHGIYKHIQNNRKNIPRQKIVMHSIKDQLLNYRLSQCKHKNLHKGIGWSAVNYRNTKALKITVQFYGYKIKCLDAQK